MRAELEPMKFCFTTLLSMELILLQMTLLFSYLYRLLSNKFSELTGMICPTRDWHYIVWISRLSVHHLRSSCWNKSLWSYVRFLYPQNFHSKSVKTNVYRHDWNSFIAVIIFPVDRSSA